MENATRNADPLLAGAPRVSVKCGADRNWRVSVAFPGHEVFTTAFANTRPTPKSVDRYVRWVADQIKGNR